MDIYSLLKYGELWGLSLGARQTKVLTTMKQFSSSGSVTELDMNGVTVVLTDGIEVHLFNKRVINVVLKLSNYWGKSSLTVLSDEKRINHRTSLGRVVELLDNARIEWKIFQKYCHDKRVELITEGSAAIEFLADGGHIIVNRIHLTEGDRYSNGEC